MITYHYTVITTAYLIINRFICAWAETWRRVWGDAQNFSRTFPETISIFTRKNSHNFCSSDFDSLFSDSLCLIVSNVIYGPFFTTKNPLSTNKSLTTPIFYSLQAFAPIPQHYFSKYWGDQCMGRPPTSNLWGDRPL